MVRPDGEDPSQPSSSVGRRATRLPGGLPITTQSSPWDVVGTCSMLDVMVILPKRHDCSHWNRAKSQPATRIVPKMPLL